MATKITGTIKWFNANKHFGFITGDDGNDHFVHASAITKGRTYPGFEEGDRVEFEAVEGRKGPQAANVELIAKVEELNEEPKPAEFHAHTHD